MPCLLPPCWLPLLLLPLKYAGQQSMRLAVHCLNAHPPHTCLAWPRSDLRKNHGKEEARARDLFYALWIPDLFMERVEVGG